MEHDQDRGSHNDDASDDRNIVAEPYERFTSTQLRTECYRRGAPPIKSGPRANYTKAGFIELLRRTDKAAANRAAGGAAADEDALIRPRRPRQITIAPARTRHCAIRLLNVLFSEQFVDRFTTEIDAVAAAASAMRLDVVTEARASFWPDIGEAFVSDLPLFELLVSDHDCLRNVDPSVAVQHHYSKLKSMWGDLARRYERTSTAMRSGAQAYESMDFFGFCKGHEDTYYLHCWLERHPHVGAALRGHRLPPPAASVGTVASVAPGTPQEPASSVAREADAREDEAGRVLTQSMALLYASRAENERAHEARERSAHTQKQLIEVVETLEHLRVQMRQYTPGGVAYNEVYDDYVWFQTRKRMLRGRLEQEEER